MPNRNIKKTLIPVVILVALGGTMALVNYLANKANAKQMYPSPHIDMTMASAQWTSLMKTVAAPVRGNPKAPFTLVEFGDFQCPMCGHAKPMVDNMLSQYPNDVNLAFCSMPLVTIHKYAQQAAVAAQAAARQGRFWQMFDVLYANQKKLEPQNLPQYASKIGLNVAKFNKDMADPALQSKVSDERSKALAMGIISTPTFLLHNNATGKTWAYLGLNGNAETKFPNDDLYLGFTDLADQPPWEGQSPDSPQPGTAGDVATGPA